MCAAQSLYCAKQHTHTHTHTHTEGERERERVHTCALQHREPPVCVRVIIASELRKIMKLGIIIIIYDRRPSTALSDNIGPRSFPVKKQRCKAVVNQ